MDHGSTALECSYVSPDPPHREPFGAGLRNPSWSCIEPRNGYNSVPLDEEYCELSMFRTPWGQCISRDAYTMCYNKVMHYTQTQTNMLVDWV